MVNVKNNNKNKKKKVLIGMSGGVDSSVAAKLLVDSGYEVAGVFLNFWKDDSPNANENRCCSLESLLDAKKVAAKIGISLYTLDFSQPFKEKVVDNFLHEYSIGRTPNPCVVCNKQIKIGKLIKSALAMGFDYVSTGHYLRLQKKNESFQLLRAKDKSKDQSYFLYTFSQEELSHLLFPLGEYKKSEVRKLAAKYKLGVESKAESQDICFLSGSHNNFLKKYLKLEGGDIVSVDDNNKVIGQHQGLPLYTIGQRRGIEIGGTGPYYVSGFDIEKNILYVVKTWNQDILYKDELIAIDVNWIKEEPVQGKIKCQAVIRYGHKSENCEVSLLTGKSYLVKFQKPQRAITSGQSVVFYNKDQVLGGGIIK
ncbi:tRNA 2-thiouridine(34) synthase MnmA [Candidatus Falkowbacteria bacterium]|nr:tRNA 2-thiouridine(34) synthase MnmA [Candidatus Falkowbacteria bacterium]